MSLCFPLLIGISGKRKFDENNLENDEAIAATVAKRLGELFDKLDDQYPGTPKIILTGAALGTDLIAIRVARARHKQHRDWAAIAILPFDASEFEKDFEPGNNDPSGPDWNARFKFYRSEFRALSQPADASSLPVTVRELPKLHVAPYVRGRSEPAVHTPDDLVHQADEPISLRDQHYEQVGQFIAESATIMIAVTKTGNSADTGRATGGTDRIVAYRRSGHADESGADVARKSKVLRRDPREPIAPPARFVWLLDPYQEQTSEPDGYPIEVLPPFRSHSITENYRQAAKLSDGTGHHELAPREQQIFESLVLARAFSRFNAQQAPCSGADIAPIAPGQLAPTLVAINKVINATQETTNTRSRCAFFKIAFLFVAAILTLETYAKFFPKHPVAMLLYLGLLGLVAVVLWRARKERWQANTEDYRGVAEMLRVQHAWWNAGLDERVDREHLQGASNDLSPVRDAATGIIAWLLLRRGWPGKAKADWPAVRGTESKARRIDIRHEMPKPVFATLPGKAANWLSEYFSRVKEIESPKDWIGDQLDYFARNAAEREDKVHITDAASWSLFIASWFVGFIILLLLLEQWALGIHLIYDTLEAISAYVGRYCGRASPFIWTLLALLPIYWRVRKRHIKRSRGLKLSFVAGAGTAILITLGLFDLAPAIALCLKGELPVATVAKYEMIVALVVLSALAGAWRYLTERLNIEAEAHEYHDAHRRFERAEHLLAEEFERMPLEPEQAQEREARAREIVLQLGRAALAEHEAWLKSRRERPLTPVVG
jgi:hypothetical protein